MKNLSHLIDMNQVNLLFGFGIKYFSFDSDCKSYY